jgi:putative phage-type endonuclease
MKKLVSTNNLSHEEWLRYRKMGIGGSDAGAICGLNPYSTAIHVYADKIKEEIEDNDNEAMRQGRDLEEYVARRFTEETGLKVRRANSIFYNEEHPFMFANVDRLLVGELVGLECKTTNILNADKWKDGDVPPHYLIQCYHYMAVTGAKAWYIAVLILGKEFKYARIERDEEIIQNLIQLEEEFWNNHVCARVMPEPDGSKAAEEVINQYFGSALQKDAILLQGFDDNLKRREELNELIGRLEQEKKKIEQEIKLFMADAEVAANDSYRITWKNTATSKLDTERLKLERPDIYKKYCKVTNSRRFLIKAA